MSSGLSISLPSIPPEQIVIGAAGIAVVIGIAIMVIVIATASRRARLPSQEGYVAKKVSGWGWVVEHVDGNMYVLHKVKVSEDGWAIAESAKKSWLIKGARPLLFQVKRIWTRVVPVWFAKQSGEIVELSMDGETTTKTIPPELSYAILNTKMLSKVVRAISQDYSALFYGMFLGLGLAVLLILVVLPAMGIPVQIGAKPINVHVELPGKEIYTLPPPGNYTPSG